MRWICRLGMIHDEIECFASANQIGHDVTAISDPVRSNQLSLAKLCLIQSTVEKPRTYQRFKLDLSNSHEVSGSDFMRSTSTVALYAANPVYRGFCALSAKI